MTLIDPTLKQERVDQQTTTKKSDTQSASAAGKHTSSKKGRVFFKLKHHSKKQQKQDESQPEQPPSLEDLVTTKLPSSTIDFLPFNRIVNADCIAQTDGQYTDMLQYYMTPLNDDNNDAQDQGYYELYRQLVAYKTGVNWIFTEFPVDVSDNLHYLQKRRQLVEHPNETLTRMTNRAEDLLQFIQSNKQSREAYLQLFADSPSNLAKLRQEILNTSGQYMRVTQMALEKKIKIISKLFNPLHPVIEGEPYQGMDPDEANPRPETLQKIVDKKHYDPAFLSQIQPMGGVSLEDQNTINLGDGYMRVLHVYSYRQQNPMFWADSAFMGFGQTVTMSIKVIDTKKIISELNRALQEQKDRAENGRTFTGAKVAASDYWSINNLADALLAGSESLFQVHTRIFVTAQTLGDTVINGKTVPGLESRIANIQEDIRGRGFQAMAFADEALQEFQAALTPFGVQSRQVPRKGQEIRGKTLAASYPFLFAQFLDPTGLYIGQTLGSSGYVTLNQFQHDRNRTSYSGWYIGKQGYGKSTAIKLTARNNTLLGNYTYLFMVSNEAKKLVEALGGLHLDGSKAIVNFLQIMPLVVDDESNQILQKESFDASIAKAGVIFNLASTVQEGSDVSDSFTVELQRFYKQWLNEHGMSMDKVTTYEPDRYPIASDFKTYLEKRKAELSRESASETADTYGKLITKLQIMIDLQSGIFDRHTEFMPGDYQLIAFDLQNLIATKQEIYNAQYYNLFNLIYSEAVKRGQHEKFLYESGKLSLDEIRTTDIVSDEFHNVVRANNLRLLNEMDRANREGRKLWIALHWATQNLADVFPNFEKRGEDESARAVRNLFALSPYRFIFRSDQANKQLMNYVFKQEISESDMDAIPFLEIGCCVANIAGTTCLKFKWELNKADQGLFSGGV